MTYTFDEFNRMQYLLGKSKYNPLTFPEQNELRTLIAKENPYAQNTSLDDLIKLGLVLVGIYLLAKTFSK